MSVLVRNKKATHPRRGMKNSKLSSGSFFNFTVLEKKYRYTLGKNERLKSRKAIDQLFAVGKSFSLFPFKVLYSKTIANHTDKETDGQRPTIDGQLKCAFSVSKRYFKKAVYRNRIKRLMREAYRLQKMDLQNQLHQNNKNVSVFILYISKELPDHALIVSKMNAVLKRLEKIINEDTVGNT
jgi:ribonuclease P protein component